jgi:adenosyl cobinamide kinase/adenosyl cobinamide phosphate guanylyltransferase
VSQVAGDADWNARIDAHRDRRPATWDTVELGEELTRLAEVIAAATPTQTLLVEDLGTWVAGVMEVTGRPALGDLWSELAASIDACPARLVLVSPEVGLSVIPATAAARAFADALGATNTAVAAVCDRVVLVIAGNAVPVKGGL